MFAHLSPAADDDDADADDDDDGDGDGGDYDDGDRAKIRIIPTALYYRNPVNWF